MTNEEWTAAMFVVVDMDRRVKTAYAQVNGTDRLYMEWMVALAPLFEAELARRKPEA